MHRQKRAASREPKPRASGLLGLDGINWQPLKPERAASLSEAQTKGPAEAGLAWALPKLVMSTNVPLPN
jgi:hypothetical protein